MTGRLVTFYASPELSDALQRTAEMERRTIAELVAGVVEAALTDGGRIALEDVAVVEQELFETRPELQPRR